jgi:hypothetical protein
MVRIGLEAVDRRPHAEGPLPPEAAVDLGNLDRQQRGQSCLSQVMDF